MEYDKKLAENLVLDEIFDLTLYKELEKFVSVGARPIFDELIPIEEKHVAFWKNFFNRSDITKLNFSRKVKLFFLKNFCRVTRDAGIHLVLEAVEVHGVKKYLDLWNEYKGTQLGKAVEHILHDELDHEDKIVLQITEKKLNPERIRNIFLGLNDGLVEILGAVSGFFAAFTTTSSVLMAGATVAVAGALSMAAGAFVATSSESEIKHIERDKEKFLKEKVDIDTDDDHPFFAASVVGVSYLFGAFIPILPVLFGATSAIASIIAAGAVIIFTSLFLAFLSGMNAQKRIMMNLIIIAAAVGVSYAIGLLARSIWGINI